MAGRDDEHRRWLGPGDPDPRPTFVIEVDGEVVGWVDVDPEPDWLGDGEANVGWAVLPQHRGHGYAAAALRQLDTAHLPVAVIEPGNLASIATARNAGFVDAGPCTNHGGRPSRRFVRP